MGAAASSSSNASSSSKKYDVFISFRGEDTRSNFTSHLYTALCLNNIETYIDYMLPRGDDISDSLIQAIQDSRISVVVFSKKYASSKWCLDELLQILHCRHYMNQIVIPVFYKVDPSHVRNQKGSYEKAFAKHETDFIHNQDKVKKWRDALVETANLAGWDFQTCRDESELIKKIVNDVLQKLDLRNPSTLDGLVGIDTKHIEMLVKNFQIIGIWGMGGIGKTTMAKVVFSKLYSQYDGCCFLENFREESEKHGLTYVRDKLLLELQNGKKAERSATNVISRLRNKRLLIVLDDVNSSKQLEYLAQECNCLGPNSRVIITTRDRHLLVGRVNEIYEAKALNYQASLKLFNLKAFHKDQSEIGYEQLAERAVGYAQGVPLALVVMGSFLYSKTEEEWESALKKLKKSPHGDIQEVLKLSYDGLDYEERKMFLDIAFFFKGEYRGDVKRLFDDFGFNASIGLRTLLDTGLITIMGNQVWMHGLIQEMGREIVRQECIKEPGRRSRLSDFQEVYDVLKNNQGTEVNEGIAFNMSLLRRDICLSANTFKKMTNLRYLNIHSNSKDERSCIVNLPWGLKSFSNKLNYLRWDKYPLECLPSKFFPENLVELHMEGSHVKRLWDGVQDIVNLREINLERCKNLLELPDLSKAKKLEKMDLEDCERLERVEIEIQLECLEYVYVSGCSNLKVFSLSSEKVTRLDLYYTGMEMLPSSIEHLNNLRELSFMGSKLTYLPDKELSRLSSLEDLCILDCGQAVDEPILQTLFDGLRSLTSLRLEGCSNLSTLPDNITNLLSLSELRLYESSIESLPSCIKHLPNLESIDLTGCKRLRSLPELPPSVYDLKARNCVSLETVDASSFFNHCRVLVRKRLCFENCVSLDVHSIQRYLFELSRKGQADHKYVEVHYPGSKVPEWFEYKQTRKDSIIIDSIPQFVDLKGFLLCCIVPQQNSFCCLECKPYVDGFHYHGPYKWDDNLQLNICNAQDFNSDHVVIWYSKFPAFYAGKFKKIEFQFHCSSDVTTELVKACGVCPIYESELHSIQVSPPTRWS